MRPREVSVSPVHSPFIAVRIGAIPVGRGASAERARAGSGCDQGAFVLLSTTLLGLVGFVLQNEFFSFFFFCRPSLRGKTTPASMRPRPFRERLLAPPKRWCRARRFSHPVARVAPRWLPQMAGPPPHPLHWQSFLGPSVRPEVARALGSPRS